MKKILLFMLIYLLSSIITKAQSVMELVRSPQITDMIRYDNTPVSLNSGRLDLNIPLIGIDDKDFTFPVTASYNSAGLMPSKPETILGLNWSLVMGGVIYREVKGIPDDIDDSNVKGFLHIIKDKKSYDPQTIINNPEQYIRFIPTPHFKDTRIEANPDLYHFQFGEYSGTFSIGYDGNPVVIAEKGGNLKVDLSNYNKFEPYSPSTFKITADNGYQYYFGGSRDNMEFSISYVNSIGNASTRIYPNAFFLYKVVASNGRELNVSYKKIPSLYNNSPIKITYESDYQQELKNYTINFSFTAFWTSEIIIGNVNYNNGGWNVGNSFSSLGNYILTKIALIDEVICGKQKLKFNYSPRMVGNERFKDTSLTLSSRCGAMLDSVNLYYNDKPVKNVKFQYDYDGRASKAFFLTRLTMPDNGSYSFKYNHTNILPDPMSADVDYWNFWRGGEQSRYPIPDIAIDKNLDYKYSSDIREPNPEYCDVSLLNRIEFPTGGNAVIEYEPHLYSKKIDRKSTSSFMPTIINLASNQIAGGARVKSIKYSDRNNRNVKSVGYEYTNSKSDKLSSGVLTYFPKYYEIIWYVIVNTSLIPINPPSIVYANTGLNISSYEQDHIRYSTVREVNIENTLGGNSTFSSSVADSNTELTKMFSRRIESGVEYWNITGMKPGGYVDIYIKQNNITKASFRLNDDQTIKYFPNIESGDYDLYYKKSTFYGFYIKINSPFVFEGPFKEVKFTDYITNPDRIQNGNIYCEIPGYNPTIYETNDSQLLQNCSGERGKIISECSYDKAGNPFERTVNTYTRNLQGVNKYSLNIHGYEGFLNQFYKSYFYPFQLSQTIHEYYDRTGVTNKVLTTTTNFEYNNHNLLRKLTTINSKGEEEVDLIRYTGDIQSGIYTQMKDKNMISFPVEKTSVRNNKVVRSSLSTYKKNTRNSDYVIEKEYKAILDFPLPYNQFVHFTATSKDSHYNLPEVEYTKYDNYNNVNEYLAKGFYPTTCFWGYNNTYPIALFEGARNDYKVTNQYEDVWNTERVALKHNASYQNSKEYTFYTSKFGSVEFHLSGAMGYNWYVTGSFDGSPIVQLVQVRTSYTDEPWWRYQNAYSYKVVVNNVSPGHHVFRINATNSYKNKNEGESDGDLSYSYWKSKSTTPEITGNDDAFYENFEESHLESVVPFGFHSSRSCTGPYTVTLPTNPQKNYTIDYQVFRNGEWNYASRDFRNGQYTINEGNDPIDEVRVYPKNAIATSFTYFPFVGLRSKTDGGYTESYEYEPYGRLAAIKDNNQKTIKTFNYKYHGQASETASSTFYNIEVQKKFKKQDCDSLRGEIGQFIQYTVPAKKYSSTISQEVANQKAYDDLIKNGQQYANENGECSNNIILSVYNPYDFIYTLEFMWGVQGNIQYDNYQINPSDKIADTGDILQDYKPMMIQLPRRNYRSVSAAREGNNSEHVELSIEAFEYTFDLFYDINYFLDFRDTYVIGGYPFPR